MNYEVVLNSREFEIVAEDFDIEKFNHGLYDNGHRLGLTREAWKGNVPLYLHDVGFFDVIYLTKKSEGVVTPDPVFSIFDKKDLTFTEMIQEIWDRHKKIVKVTPGDENPYE